MTRLTWDAPGERFYESGIDRGVLYVQGEGYAWPGLVSVSENPTGGEATPYYIDGYKYLNVASAEEFEATIEAFFAPSAFGACMGVNQTYGGLMITQQPKKSFGFCYRTLVGNDTEALEHGYKIHLVYNALAGPSKRTYSTITDRGEAQVQTWDITTRAPQLSGFRPTAHFVVDSRFTESDVMAEVEDLIYGTETSAPRQPRVAELLNMFGVPVYDAGELPNPNGDTILDGGLP